MATRARRLQSLDVARGVTIALMIFVDHAGDSWEHVDHTPWDGVRLADFVMPSFDVIVGVAVAFSVRQGRLKVPHGASMAAWRAHTRRPGHPPTVVPRRAVR